MNNDAIIRNAEIKDLPYILDIMNEAIINTTAIYDYHERDEKYVQKWYQQLHETGMPVIVCEADGKCVAYGCYSRFRPKDGYRFCVEHSVYIHKDYRGKGYGAMLLSELIIAAKQQKIHTMIAGIDAANSISIEFHKKFGFVEVGFLKEVGYKFDRWLDLIFMEKIL